MAEFGVGGFVGGVLNPPFALAMKIRYIWGNKNIKMYQENKEVQPIYIKELTLENIKCFGPKQTLSLSKNGKPKMWTMIMGDNGTGKSTILQALALAFPLSIMDYLTTNMQSFIKDREIYGIIKMKDVNHNYISNRIISRKENDISIQEKKEGNKEFKKLEDYNIPIFGYSSYRVSSKNRLRDNKDSQFSNLFNENNDLINAEGWLLQADYSDLKGAKQSKYADKVKVILLNVLRQEVSDIQIRKKQRGYGVEFKTRYGWVNINNLSTGYKSLIAWMVDLANWLNIYYPESENPLNEQAVVLVDEIDLHLHVSLQRNLVSFLRETFPKVQFIVTAHSPLIAQGSEEENLIVLEKNGDHVLIKDNPLNVKNWRVDQLLTSDLFGLDSARSITTEEKMNRRYELLKKDKLTKQERAELEKLNAYMYEVPVREDSELDEASKIIRDAAVTLKRLKAQGK